MLPSFKIRSIFENMAMFLNPLYETFSGGGGQCYEPLCNTTFGEWKVENGKLTIPRPLREREEFQVESESLKLRNSGVGLLNGKWKIENGKLAYSLNHLLTCRNGGVKW